MDTITNDGWADLARWARRQGGMFSRGQALAAGVTHDRLRRRLRAGELVRVTSGVYRSASAPVTPTSELWTAILAGGQGARLSHATAAQVFDIDCPRPAGPPSITVPASRRISRPGVATVHRSRCLTGSAVSTHKGFPVASPARILLDVAAEQGRPAVDRALADAVRSGLVTADYLARVLPRIGESGGHSGARPLRSALGEHDPGFESGLEQEHEEIIRGFEVPPPTPQLRVYDGPLLVARLDLGWEEFKVGSEANGFAFHSRRPDWQRDHERRRMLRALGWDILEWTTEDIRQRPELIGPAILAALERAARRLALV